MTKDLSVNVEQHIRTLRDNELDAVTGGAIGATARFVSVQTQFSWYNGFSPILLPPNPC